MLLSPNPSTFIHSSASLRVRKFIRLDDGHMTMLFSLFGVANLFFIDFDWSTVFAFFEQAMKQFWKQASEKPLQGLSKSSKMKDAECDIKLHQNIPSNSSVTCPLDISLENIGTCHKKELPAEEMRRSSWLKPCQRNAGYLVHAGCSSQLRFNDSLANFGYPHAQLGYANSDKQCFAGVSSCLLKDNIISDQASSFGDRYGMSDRERRNNIPDVSEDSGSVQKRTVDISLNFHPFDIIDNVENIRFPESCFAENERSHSPGYKMTHSKSYTNQRSLDVGFDSLVKFSPFYDIADNAEADNGFSVWHTQVLEKDSTCRPSTSVIGKCQENYDLEIPSNGRMDSFSCGEAPFYKKDKLDDALVSDFLVDDPKSGFLQLDWCLDEPQLSAKKLKSDAQICDSRGCLPSFTRTSSGYSGSIENVEILNFLQDSSDDVFPAKYTKTELDFRFDFSPISNMQYPSLSNQNAFGKVSPFSLFNNETGWSPSESSNMTNAEIYSKHQSSMQIQDEGYQSFRDELDLQNSRLSEVYKVRSKRSCSAPPFYEGKRRFSTINDHLTTTAEKGSTSHVPDVSNVKRETISPVNYLSQPPSSSQPCFKPNVNEIFQTLSRKHTGEKVSSLQMDETKNDGKVSEVEGSIAKLEYALAIPTKWRTGIPQSTDRDVSHTSKDNVLSISSGILHLSASSLIPDSINKECLQNARVLQQLDKKFIPVMAGQILVIVDQHAADERIRLEDLRRKVLSGEGNSVIYLDSEQELVLPEMGYQLLQKYTDQIRNWGWICNIHNQCLDSFTKNVNILKRRKCNITLVAVPCILGINLNEKDLIEFIEQLVETDGSSTIPPAVVRILNFKACRGAIMFGDSLLPSECSLILEELKATSLCFQCAHGRPTTVPLLNVAALHEQLRVLEVEKGGPGETWHGLSQHKPSIKRAQMRLESAKRFQGG
ncbi:uncharacterized protein A4U43_C07F23300 [Asparagus officinalis]|uniref:MutL C-terminal dimerisation domain-containing protein n=1 Tax=Asparagus officinalis TaxID=4686 RepID=A0A5P1EEC6_ASPOF|nr:uncharacterized protein A4U43_C07F23300 [Asparagus officinalis]